MHRYFKIIFSTGIGLFLFPLLSIGAVNQPAVETLNLMHVLINVLLVLIFLIMFYLVYLLKVFVDQTRADAGRQPVFHNLMRTLTSAVPVENEQTILTDHIYDGIRELDNDLPLWWKYMFYACILFAGAYMYYYHFDGNDRLQDIEYANEMATAQKQVDEFLRLSANSIDETNVKVVNDVKKLEHGKSLFLQNCAACHGKGGEGGVGPNLTDEYWLHGGQVKDIFKTIKYGVPQKGMISWKAQLNPANIQELSSFILSIQGSKPANPKEPQGEKLEPNKDLAHQ